MKLEKIKYLLISVIVIILVNTNLKAQDFKGLGAFVERIEYEGQRYLMEDIYKITSVEFDQLKIDKTIKEIDKNEGFAFVLTSYVFNGKSGVVITSLNSVEFQNNRYEFTNVHLTNEEYTELYNTFISLEKNKPGLNVHLLKEFNDRLIVDVWGSGFSTFTLWVDKYSRHTFSPFKWDKAFKRYKKFIED